MERNVAFNLLHDLMNVTVQHTYRAEALQIRERLGACVSSPSPLGINQPRGNVGEDHDRRARFQALHVVLKPFELFFPESAEPTCFEINHIDQTDEMHTLLVETVPAITERAFTVAFAILFSVVV